MEYSKIYEKQYREALDVLIKCENPKLIQKYSFNSLKADRDKIENRRIFYQSYLNINDLERTIITKYATIFSGLLIHYKKHPYLIPVFHIENMVEFLELNHLLCLGLNECDKYLEFLLFLFANPKYLIHPDGRNAVCIGVVSTITRGIYKKLFLKNAEYISQGLIEHSKGRLTYNILKIWCLTFEGYYFGDYKEKPFNAILDLVFRNNSSLKEVFNYLLSELNSSLTESLVALKQMTSSEISQLKFLQSSNVTSVQKRFLALHEYHFVVLKTVQGFCYYIPDIGGSDYLDDLPVLSQKLCDYINSLINLLLFDTSNFGYRVFEEQADSETQEHFDSLEFLKCIMNIVYRLLQLESNGQIIDDMCESISIPKPFMQHLCSDSFLNRVLTGTIP
jgi:hypothetical protein